VILRGLERGAIVKDEVDREAFVMRLAHVAEQGGLTVYAWILVPRGSPTSPSKWRGTPDRQAPFLGPTIQIQSP
jgi:hypothetical protein